MKIFSSAFENNKSIPKKYTCQGEGINPPLSFSDIPISAKSLALIVDDPDAPNQTFVHFVLFDMPIVTKLDENASLGKEGINSLGELGYTPPCPPTGVHRYFFKLYALDTKLNVNTALTKEELENKMKGHVLAKAEVIGLYNRA